VLSVKDIEAAITKETRLLAVTHASNVNGIIQPIAEYGALARRRNIIFLVDAAQTAGKYPLDVRADSIGLLAFSGHKGLYGPPGTGALYVGEKVELDSFREGGTGSYSEDETQPQVLPDKFESGTVNSVGIAGLGAGLQFILEEGLDKIIAHEQALTNQLIYGLERIPGVTIYTAGKKSQQAPVVSFNIKGYTPGDMGTILDQAFDTKVRTGLHCSPAAHKTLGTFPLGSVRISPGYMNIPQDIEMTLKAVERISGAQDLKLHGVSAV
jgi:selenocysteine lyase/cysteine desulfurase